MHSIVTTFRGADIKVEVANFCAAMDTLIDQDDIRHKYVKWTVSMVIADSHLIFLRGLCGYIWVNIIIHLITLEVSLLNLLEYSITFNLLETNMCVLSCLKHCNLNNMWHTSRRSHCPAWFTS